MTVITGALNALAAYAARFRVSAEVWRMSTTTDAGGGEVVAWVQQTSTEAQLVSPSAAERETARQQGAEISHTIILSKETTLQRGDRLILDGRTVELTADPQTATQSAVARAPGKEETWDESTS